MRVTLMSNEDLREALNLYAYPQIGEQPQPTWHDLAVIAEACNRCLTYIIAAEKDRATLEEAQRVKL